MTERLYYTDAYLTDFDARVLSVTDRDGQSAIVLDRTGFYPTSGGQPFDTGTIDGAPVVDVADEEGGHIAHLVRGTVEPGRTVRGRIDWERRFDHMQQHTGQHVLSAAFDRLHRARTVGFHLGRETSTIDLSVDLSVTALASAETAANGIVWENRPVKVAFVGAEEAARLEFRKEPARTGELRVIDVQGFDLSACGGTHVSATGSIGIILIAGSERFRGGTRVEFACGGRALASYRALRAPIDESVRLLSVLPADLPGAIDRLQTEGRDAKRIIKDLGDRIAVYEADALAARASLVGGIRVVVEPIQDADAGRLRALAAALTGGPHTAAALISDTSPHLLVVARSKDVDLNVAAVVRDLTTRFGGRGGGRGDMAQAGGLGGTTAELLERARGLIADRVGG